MTARQPPGRTIRVRVPPSKRLFLHFHLEASDGLACLLDSGDPEIGLIDLPRGQARLLHQWLAECRASLQITILPDEERSSEKLRE